ncbi:ArnT family glycosyltransferase [Desulfovibrio sp. Fe33]|uniref:ArnT family glycosyltransferase n=1 Tax=Desulfovibrio sp. Fe33 TaxID=3020842 RepID=UPI00234D1B15|nr:glycosyltransferase family 39 protein [Desulfovibrio sp. Fe33]
MQDSTITEINNKNRPFLLYGCLLFLAVFSFLFRYFASDTVETGGDAIYKWSLIKQFILFGDIPLGLNHHTCRWAINIPLSLVAKCCGTEPTGYYIWPFIASTLSAIFSFLLVERLRTWRVGLATGILVILSGPMLRQGTQLLPMGTALLFLLGALYFLVRWRDNRHGLNLLASALFLFLAYGAKITIVYYLPSFLVLIYMFSKDKQSRLVNILFFLGIFLACFAMETMLFNALAGSSFGRLELVQLSHHPIRAAQIAPRSWQSQSNTLLQYLANFFVYFKYSSNCSAALYYTAFSVAVLALVRKWRSVYITAIPFLFGFIGHAYAITSVFPFHRPEQILPRYLSAIFELALITIILFLSAPRFRQLTATLKLPFSLDDRKIRMLLFLLLAIPIVAYAGKHLHMDSGYAKTARAMKEVREARQNGVPVLILLPRDSDKRAYRRNKLIVKFRAFYTDARHFGNTHWPTDPNIDLDDFPMVARKGKTFLLVERNGFKGDLADKGLYLVDY